MAQSVPFRGARPLLSLEQRREAPAAGVRSRLAACSLLRSSFRLDEALSAVGERVCLELSGCLARCGAPAFSADKEAVLKGRIRAVGGPDDPVRRIMGTWGAREVTQGHGQGAGAIIIA